MTKPARDDAATKDAWTLARAKPTEAGSFRALMK
jgi:hypothetical protein